MNDELDTDFKSEDFESIGGLVLGNLNGVPQVNDYIEIDGVKIYVMKVHKNRIAQLKLVITKQETDHKEEGEDH